MGLDQLEWFKKDDMTEEVLKISNKNKWKDRTDIKLNEWRKDRYYLRDQFLDDWINLDKEKGLNHNVETIQYKDVSVEEFMEWFEIPSVPCLIDGATADWPAL